MERIESRGTAADLAAYAALLEIAEDLGLSSLLDRGEPFTPGEAATAADVPERSAVLFLDALVSAGLLERDGGSAAYVPVAELAERRYEAGYLSWALNANRPYIDNAALFLRDPEGAGARYQRDGRRVAVSSRWIGSYGFYPGAIEEITDRKPRRVADLGAGAGGLLIHLLTALPGSTGVALDLSAAACEEAERAAGPAGVAERLRVVHRSIESLVDDPEPVRGADVIHAGFVLHDVVGRREVIDGILGTCRESLAPGGALVVTDAVPYADGPGERGFSALFTYLHASSMDVRLPSTDDWLAAFRRAGFAEVRGTPLPMPGSRKFVATA
ncbi:class I SAM-dependent methyltransferase [Streptomyces sp. NPDC050504]|uniref:class I SAM-dependent methyltransferase n=1 Tax=Streptomyces sp. NPDC050504 TaxID=3365618 RepID=UPI0037B3C131